MDECLVNHLESAERALRKKKIIKHQDVFDCKNKSKHLLYINKMSVSIRKHNFSENDLKAMKVTQLKTVVRQHNLHNVIKKYSTMRKADLITKMMAFAGIPKSKPKSRLEREREAQNESARKVALGEATYVPKRHTIRKPKKKQKINPDTKPVPDSGISELLVPGITKPMYKEGLKLGAKKQFEKKYGNKNKKKR